MMTVSPVARMRWAPTGAGEGLQDEPGSARPSDHATAKARRAEKSTETRPEPACVLAARISGTNSTITASNSARVSVSITRPGMSVSEI